MRVTDQMISEQTVFNLQRSLRRFAALQTSQSTGRRINTPSDDPIGTVRDLDYRTQLSNIAQFRKNISVAQSWTQNYDSILGQIKDYATNTKEIAVAMSDGTYDNTARQASANEVQSLIDQIMSLANNELEGRRVFAGYQTKSKPFTVTAAGLSYTGDTGALEFDIESGQRTTVNLNGQEVFLKQLSTLGEKADLDIALTGANQLSDLNSGGGVSLVPGTFTITDRNLNITATVDLAAAPPAATIDDAIARINASLTAAGITNLTVGLGPVRNALTFTPTQNGLVSTATQIARINNGTGATMVPGKIHVSNGAGIDMDVDVTGSTTLNDVITKFNAQLSAAGVNNVTMSINAANRGLQITDTNGVPLDLVISDASATDQTASQLGMAGSVSPTLVGTDLNPQVDFSIDETTGTTAANLGIKGAFNADYVGSDLNPRLTATSQLADLKNGLGLGSDAFVLRQGNAMATISPAAPGMTTIQDFLDAINNSGLDVTASINASGRGIQIVNNDTTKSFTIEEAENGRAAKSMGLFGSSDLIGSMVVLVNALRKDDQEGSGLLLQNIDDGIQHLLNYRATVGARGMRLEATDKRLIDVGLSFTSMQSEVEDADLTKVVTDLATQENAYQAALQATARIIQPSLLDFLR